MGKAEASVSLPEIARAQSELGRRYLRAVVALLIRVVAVALLEALLLAQAPGLRSGRSLLDLGGGVIVLWPFFASVGRIYGQRIALGRRYVEAGRPDDASAILAPVEGWRARFFDPMGEGLFWRANAAFSNGNHSEAIRLLDAVVLLRGSWGERARDLRQRWEGEGTER